MGEVPDLDVSQIEEIAAQRVARPTGPAPDMNQVDWLACWAS